MYQRLYGTRHHVMPRDLVPIEHEPWLRAKSVVPRTLGVIFGCVGVIFVTLFLGATRVIPALSPSLGIFLLLLSALAGLVVLICLVLLWEERSSRAMYQYCPECLSYMTRGATVCPFCGVRGAAPGAPSSAQPRDRARIYS